MVTVPTNIHFLAHTSDNALARPGVKTSVELNECMFI